MCTTCILEFTVFKGEREEEEREGETVPRIRTRGNTPLTLPNKRKKNNEVKHHKANNKTTEKK